MDLSKQPIRQISRQLTDRTAQTVVRIGAKAYMACNCSLYGITALGTITEIANDDRV